MKVDRLPSTGETLLGSGYRVDYGGKGSNQAVGCARLGAEVRFVAKIGKDSFGDMALDLYRTEGIDVSYIRRTDAAPTGVGFIIVERPTGRNCIVLDAGANELLSPTDVAECDAGLGESSVVLTQLEIPVDAAEAALARGRQRGATTILNPAPVRPLPRSLLQLVDILTPNESEAKVLAGQKASGLGLEASAGKLDTTTDSLSDVEAMARELIRCGVKQVVITLGENGALLVDSTDVTHISAPLMTAVDTTGAGDAFNAGLATALASGATLRAAVEFAVVTGGLAVTKEGVIPSLPRREEVIEFYGRSGLAPPNWLEEGQARPSLDKMRFQAKEP
jgi:ribokinase